MKYFIKKYFPQVFKFIKKIYSVMPHYKKRIKLKKENNEAVKNARINDEKKIMATVFDEEYVVHNGPFVGMKYIKRSSGSALLPKIMGSYEEPIHAWIEKIIEEKKINKILDIGCAEGYYACGFGYRMPNAEIIAYDIDEQARKNTNELLELNNVENVVVKSECTHQELQQNSDANTLIFCDIEGYEDVLLDLEKTPNLKKADLLIESHDCFVPGITDELIRRFYKTHKIQIIVDYPFRLSDYKVPKKYQDDVFYNITNEYRSPFMKFLYLESSCE